MRPYASGAAYQNYIDAELEDWEHAYYGSNLTRLRRIKHSYDPGDRFAFAQGVRPRAR
jgi:FAD/FMN-containing dehydrogenase